MRKLFINAPLENFKVNIGVFDNENTMVTDVLSDSAGRFHLEEIDFTGNARLIASSVGGKEKYKGWLMLDSLNYTPSEIQSSMIESISLTKENLSELKEEAEWKSNIKNGSWLHGIRPKCKFLEYRGKIGVGIIWFRTCYCS